MVWKTKSSWAKMQWNVKNTNFFTFLGNVITTEGGSKEELLHRVSKAKFDFAQLKKIWNSAITSFKTKLRFFHSNDELLEKWYSYQLRRRKWNWIDHTLRKPSFEPYRNALEWNPQGGKWRRKLTMSWTRSLDIGIGNCRLTGKKLKMVAKDRDRCGNFVKVSLATSGHSSRTSKQV